MREKRYSTLFAGLDLERIPELLQDLDALRKAFAEGLLDTLIPYDEEHEYAKLKEFLGPSFDPNDLKRKVELGVEQMLRGGSTLQVAFGISDEGMEGIYFLGYTMFKQRNYPAARRLFELLTYLTPHEERYFHALASTAHQQKDFLTAARHYGMAIACSELTNPELYFHLADCYAKMDDLFSAVLALGHCIDGCDDRLELHRDLKQRSTNLKGAFVEELKRRERHEKPKKVQQEGLRRFALSRIHDRPGQR